MPRFWSRVPPQPGGRPEERGVVHNVLQSRDADQMRMHGQLPERFLGPVRDDASILAEEARDDDRAEVAGAAGDDDGFQGCRYSGFTVTVADSRTLRSMRRSSELISRRVRKLRGVVAYCAPVRTNGSGQRSLFSQGRLPESGMKKGR